MRSEISSWNERTNYRHPRANRRYSGHPRLSTANACGRSDRQTLSDPWALDGLESRADAQRMVDLHETLLGIEYHDRRLTYTTLQDRPREFLAATGLTHAQFAHLLPGFAPAHALLYPPEKTLEGMPRQRRAGGGATGTLPQMADKLLFILVFQKANPL